MPPSPQYRGFDPREHGGYVIGIERINDICDEVAELHKAHWDETEVLYLDEALDPDYDTFKYMESQVKFILFTARTASGELVGNLMYFLGTSVHIKGRLQAKEDAFFLTKEHRGGDLASAFLGYAEYALKKLGVHYIGMSDKSPTGGKSLKGLMTKHGYKAVAVFYNKRLVVGDEEKDYVLQ